MFVENSRSNLEAIRAAIATNDYQKVSLEAHSIKRETRTTKSKT